MVKRTQTEGIIYCYTNKINNKKYIGQTTNENLRRIKFHTQEEYCTSHKNGGRLSHFDNARKKYGVDSFAYEVLEQVTAEDLDTLHLKLDKLERFYISKYDSYNNGYNSTTGGSSGWIASKETKDLMSNIAKRRFRDPNSHPMYGKHHSEEAKKRISNSKKGTKTGGNNSFSKAVICYTKQGEFIREFSSIAEANLFVGKPRNATSINRCCAGTLLSAYGYVWKFKNN